MVTCESRTDDWQFYKPLGCQGHPPDECEERRESYLQARQLTVCDCKSESERAMELDDCDNAP